MSVPSTRKPQKVPVDQIAGGSNSVWYLRSAADQSSVLPRSGARSTRLLASLS